MEKPLVSIVIPCYNQGHYLQEAVDSVLASTYENIEIIVVNDGSDLNIEGLSAQFPKTQIINQEKQGVCVARNNAIENASGKYILPLDADDKIHPTYIEKAVNMLENNPKIGIVYCEAEFFGAKTGKWQLAEYKFPDCLYGNGIFVSVMYRKSDWEIGGGYKKEMTLGFEDWEFWLTLIENGVEVYKIPEILFFYRQHDNSRSAELVKNVNSVIMLKQIMKLHPNLYIDNLEKILLPLQRQLEYFSSRANYFSRIRFQVSKILRKMLEIVSSIS